MSLVDQQLRRNDCGISAIKTVFNILKKEVDRNYIRDNIFLDEKGSSLANIKKFFDDNGCISSFKFLDVHLIDRDLSALNPFFPFIVPIKKKNQLHYVVANEIKNGKIKIFDPARMHPYHISLAEFKNIAHYADSYWDLIDFRGQVETMCSLELSRHSIQPNGYLVDDENISQVFNKLVYFSHVTDNFKFADEKTERLFLKELLDNQELQMLPKQFRQLKFEKEKARVSAPLILHVKAIPEKKFEDPNQPRQELSVYARLMAELKENKSLWHTYLCIALITASVTQVGVFINQILIDHVLPSFQLNILILFAIGFGLFRIFNLLISQYKSYVSIHVGNILDKYFLSAFNDKLNRFSLRYTQSYRKGDLTERLSDSMKLKSFFTTTFSRILVDTIVSLYSLCILFYINWQLTLLVCLVTFLFFTWFKIMTPYLQSNERTRFIMKADFISKMMEKIDGNQVIKCFRIESVFSNKVVKSIKELVDIQTKTKKLDLLNGGVVSIITTISYTLIVIFLARDSILTQALTLGQLITFISLSERIFSTLGRILEENLTLRENEVIMKRYFDFEESIESENESKGIEDFSIESISLENVGFGYNPLAPILKDINLTIYKGERIKIEGGNGSGKSSLSKILSFLYNADRGDIIVNGVKSNLFNREILKSKILLVSNEDILFNETLEFNICFGRGISHSKIIGLAQEIGFYDFIASHDDGLAFTIGEHGKNLSTGQRKKILMMRALLSNAEIVILDEVLSGIDMASREKIEDLINVIEDKTFIIISHEQIKNITFDRNFAMTNGELIYA